MQEQRSNGSLLKVLGVAFGLAVIIGNTIGMGILRTPGEIAAQLPSAGWYLSVWVLGAGYALLGALTLSELATMIPRSGGQFALVHEALGPFPGFVVGWTDWMSTCCSVAAVAIVIGEYLGPLVPILEGYSQWTASAVVLLFSALQWHGIKIGDRTQRATSLLKALALVGLALIALYYGLTGQVVHSSSAETHDYQVPNGIALLAAIVVAVQAAIFTYDGWTGAIYFGEEVTEPEKNIPRAMIGGVLLVMAIYLSLNVAFLMVVPVDEMAGDPFVAATVATRLFGPSGDDVIRILMLISLVAAVNSLVLMASRVPYAMAREKLLPRGLTAVNHGGTPTTALAASCIVSLAFVVTNSFDTALAMLAFFFVASYTLSFSSLFAMRIRQPQRHRPFKVPLYPIVPGLALLGSLAFLLAAIIGDFDNSVWSIGLVALSAPAYWIAKRTQRVAD